MINDLNRYISGERNAIKDVFTLSREKCGQKEYVHVCHPELPEPLYEFWTTRRRPSRTAVPGSTRHTTGGKKPYVMLMIEELTALIASGTSADSIGYLVCLSPYIEWGTGRLLVGRKKRGMAVDDICRVFGKSRRHTLRILAGLKECGLLERRAGGYAVPRCLVKRGGAARAD